MPARPPGLEGVLRAALPGLAAFALVCLTTFHGAAYAKGPRAQTDAFTIESPSSPWKRAASLDPPGLLSFGYDDAKGGTALIRVSLEGTLSGRRDSAAIEVLAVQVRALRAQVDGKEGYERSAFQPDSMVAGGLFWRGFRVRIETALQRGETYRWVALHPGFPGRRRAFLLAFDEYTAKDAKVPNQLAEVRRMAGTLLPKGKGLAGNLEEGWLDARLATYAARIDSSDRLCWTVRPDAPAVASRLGLGRGFAIEGDFYQMSERVPNDSLVDRESRNYGTAFDRNGDGRYDLVFTDRGVQAADDGGLLPLAVAVADDNFDGTVDGSVIETGDANGDNRVDHRLVVRDTNGDGKPDRAIRFRDAIAGADTAPLKIEQGYVVDRLLDSKAERVDFESAWRDASALLAELSAARAACRR